MSSSLRFVDLVNMPAGELFPAFQDISDGRAISSLLDDKVGVYEESFPRLWKNTPEFQKGFSDCDQKEIYKVEGIQSNFTLNVLSKNKNAILNYRSRCLLKRKYLPSHYRGLSLGQTVCCSFFEQSGTIYNHAQKSGTIKVVCLHKLLIGAQKYWIWLWVDGKIQVVDYKKTFEALPEPLFERIYI